MMAAVTAAVMAAAIAIAAAASTSNLSAMQLHTLIQGE